jgi:hypothetical protein
MQQQQKYKILKQTLKTNETLKQMDFLFSPFCHHKKKGVLKELLSTGDSGT